MAIREKESNTLKQEEISGVVISDIASILSDEKTLGLLKAICGLNAAGESCNMNNEDILRLKTKLSARQYHLAIQKLTESGLIRTRMHYVRGDGDRYDKSRSLTPTLLGKQICMFLKILETGLRLKPKLRALDSLEMSGRLTKEERDKIIDALIDDIHTRKVLKQEPREFQ